MLEVLRRIVVLSLVCARSHALLELMQAHAKPEAAFGTPVDMQRAASGMGAGRPLGPQNPQEGAGRPLGPQNPQEGAGRPLGPQNPQNPQTPRPMVAANPANPANPAAPATNLQGALRMSMGSLMGFCRCEACESVLGDLIDNLEDDFPGRQYTEGDIYALINDRFCYGVKWVFRSPCRYILQKYMDEVIELVMVEATEREVCEQLRFCW